MNWTLFEHLDRTRRLQGAMMDAAGLGPAETLYETAYRAQGISLRRYGEAAGSGPLVLIVPAPIKRPYIWDLSPAVSAVRRCLAAPSRVFLVDWQRAAPEFGLGDYTERLILDCLNATEDEGAHMLMAVLPASRKLKLADLRSHTGRMLRLATEAELRERFDDCELGAVPPIGKAYGMETILDDSLMAQPELYFEAGDHETLVRVKTSDFVGLLEGAPHMPFSAPVHEDGPRSLF